MLKMSAFHVSNTDSQFILQTYLYIPTLLNFSMLNYCNVVLILWFMSSFTLYDKNRFFYIYPKSYCFMAEVNENQDLEYKIVQFFNF